MKPNQELYMIEYGAIHIVYTLQGLYTWTHSPRGQRGVTLTNSEAPVYCHEINSYGHHPTYPGLCTISRERSSQDCEASPYFIGAHED